MDEIEEYEATRKYLKDVLNGRTVISEKEWHAELKRLLERRFKSVESFYKLRDDVKNVDDLRRGAKNIMDGITPERTTELGKGVWSCERKR